MTAALLVPLLGPGPAFAAGGLVADVLPDGFVPIVLAPPQKPAVRDPVVVADRQLDLQLRVGV